jgi:23S rRNA-/tRNA-specific pseudouridylate synthase
MQRITMNTFIPAIFSQQRSNETSKGRWAPRPPNVCPPASRWLAMRTPGHRTATSAHPGIQPKLIAAQDGLWVVDKPSGWTILPETRECPDVASWLVQQGVPTEISPASSLDRAASGIVVFRVTAPITNKLEKQSKWHAAKLTYRAIVHRAVNARGVIRRPLPIPGRRNPVEAVTRYDRLEVVGRFSVVSIEPETQRRHQIRQHFQRIGHGVFGDRRYRTRSRGPAVTHRLCLHAERVEFRDGRGFTAAWPAELEGVVKTLRTLASRNRASSDGLRP